MANHTANDNDGDVQIREAQPDDAPAIIQFLREASQESDAILVTGLDHLTNANEADNLATIQRSRDCEVVTALYAGRVIGIGTVMVKGEQQGTGELGVVVEREYWHNGIGSALLDIMIDWYQNGSSLNQLVLDVFADNQRAISLYQHYGFVATSRGKTRTANGIEKPLLHMIYQN